MANIVQNVKRQWGGKLGLDLYGSSHRIRSLFKTLFLSKLSVLSERQEIEAKDLEMHFEIT